MKENLEKVFNQLEDPRSNRNQKHPLISLISIALLGAVAGIDSFNGLGDFAEAHFDHLLEFIELPNGPPSHGTFQRLFEAMDVDEFHECFFDFTQNLATIHEGIIAIDGKTIRNSGENPLHIVNAWCEENKLVLAQQCVEKKSNEITAIPILLKLLDLNNRIVTLDAMGCQRKIAQQIIEQNGDYLINLKGNQSNLHEDVKKHFADLNKLTDDATVSSWEEHDKGHGRVEHRKCYATSNITHILTKHQWPGLTSIGMVISTRQIKDKVSTDTRYYLSSLKPSAEKICKTARAHWGIENKLHWRLDVVYNEDKACISNENGAENMSLMRKWALNILNQQKGKSTIKSLQRKSAMSFKFLKKMLLTSFHA